MKAEVKWLEESKFVAGSGTRHSLVIDTPDSNKGPQSDGDAADGDGRLHRC